ILQPDVTVEPEPVAHQKPGRAQRLWIGRRDFVARQHLEDHPVVAFIIVQRLDDPVAPAPDVAPAAPYFVGAAPIPIAVAPDVHPVTAPSLAILRARQKLIYHLLIGILGAIGQKRVDLLPSGWDSDQVEIHPSQQCVSVSLRQRRESLSFMFGSEKGVDGVANPRAVLHGWRRRTSRRPKRPMIAPRSSRRRRGGLQRRIERRTRPDPLRDPSNLFIRQLLAAERHPGLALMTYIKVKEALFRVAWNHRWPMIATPQQLLPGGNLQT